MKQGTVLVVEDEAELRDMLGDALRYSGYSVVTARDGEDALELLPAIESCCVIVLDLVMPRMDGWALLEKLHAAPAYSRIPVIVHTSSPEAAPRTATKIFQKPVELDRLLSAIREVCGT